MFRVGEEYTTKGGQKVLVVKTDCDVSYNDKKCSVLAIVEVNRWTPTSGLSHGCYFYSEDGKYCAVGNVSYDLVSNEPTVEETALIREIGDYCERRTDDSEEKLLKIIRQLRKK